jgi:hypothetical protein
MKIATLALSVIQGQLGARALQSVSGASFAMTGSASNTQ